MCGFPSSPLFFIPSLPPPFVLNKNLSNTVAASTAAVPMTGRPQRVKGGEGAVLRVKIGIKKGGGGGRKREVS